MADIYTEEGALTKIGLDLVTSLAHKRAGTTMMGVMITRATVSLEVDAYCFRRSGQLDALLILQWR